MFFTNIFPFYLIKEVLSHSKISDYQTLKKLDNFQHSCWIPMRFLKPSLVVFKVFIFRKQKQ